MTPVHCSFYLKEQGRSLSFSKGLGVSRGLDHMASLGTLTC